MMRYYSTAFLRESDENREMMHSYMSITANFLACSATTASTIAA